MYGRKMCLKFRIAAFLSALPLLVSGCGNKDSASGQSASTGSAGNAGSSSVSTGGTSCTNPQTAVPDGWARPADCKGVGNLCSEGCSGAACQLLGDVCIPFSQVGASSSACAPYCMAYACMNFDDASCFCTGSAAAKYPSCACGPKAVAGVCAGEGAACASKACCDCMGLRCVTDSYSGSVCRQACVQNSDCVTGCCDTAAGTCHDALYCNCVNVGTACSGTTQCCPGKSCLTFSGDATNGPFSCYQDCKTQSDCPSGCCSQKIPGTDHGACGPCN